MDKTYLPDLISGLEQELLRLGYTKGSMTFYRRRWNQLMAYAEDRGECYYTEQLGMDFLKEFFGITQEDFSRTLPQAETQEIRVVRMVGDFQLHHAVLRRYLKHKEILTTPFLWISAAGSGVPVRKRLFPGDYGALCEAVLLSDGLSGRTRNG